MECRVGLLGQPSPLLSLSKQRHSYSYSSAVTLSFETSLITLSNSSPSSRSCSNTAILALSSSVAQRRSVSQSTPLSSSAFAPEPFAHALLSGCGSCCSAWIGGSSRQLPGGVLRSFRPQQRPRPAISDHCQLAVCRRSSAVINIAHAIAPASLQSPVRGAGVRSFHFCRRRVVEGTLRSPFLIMC